MPTQGNAATNAAIVAPVTTAETAVATTQPVVYNAPGGEGNACEGNIVITTGAAATGVTIRVRQGVGVAGAIVGTTGIVPTGASVVADLGYSFLDASALATNSGTPLQYTVTVQQNAATGNASIAAGAGFIDVNPVTGAS